MMEKKLTAMFDYQRFENNSRLAKMIAATESRYVRALDDDELTMVSAAGIVPESKFISPEIEENPKGQKGIL